MATNQKNQSNERQSNQHGQGKSNSGNNSGNFANMDDNKQREIASKGGKAAHSGGNSSSKH